MNKLILILAIASAFAGCSNGSSSKSNAGGDGQVTEASDPSGAYFGKREDLGNGQYTPETLMILSTTELIHYTVHDGAKIADKTSIAVKNNKISFGASEAETLKFDCNGFKVTRESNGSEGGEVQFKKGAEGIDFIAGEESVKYSNASEADVKRILELPDCKLINE